MQELRDKFLEQIKSTLLGHEEPYDEGAWERFAAKNISKGSSKPAKAVPIWKWAAAAAAVLIGAVLLLQYFNAPDTVKPLKNDNRSVVKTDTKNQSLKDSQAVLTDTTNAIIATVPENNIPNTNTHIIVPQKQYAPSPIINEMFKQQGVTAEIKNKQVKPATNTFPTPAPPVTAQNNPVLQKQQTQPVEKKPVNKPFWESSIEKDMATLKPAPQNNNNNNAVAINRQPVQRKQKATDKTSKWLSSLYVSPNFSNEGVNMGYGYSLGYALNDKIKVGSGIAYTKVSTSKNFDAPTPSNALALDGDVGVSSYSRSIVASNVSTGPSAPYMQSMNSWIAGIDVPVEVTYTVNKNLYATGGVSGLFVMSGEDTKKMVRDLNSRAPITNSAGTVKGYSSLAEESKPEYQTSKNDNTSFLGFYNLSAGYKQKISDKNSVSLEPFIKIPMKQVSEQKLNYTGVGIRLKFDF